MNQATRLILILMLILPAWGALSAQESAPTDTATTATATVDATTTATTTEQPAQSTVTVEADATSYEVRDSFTRLLQRHPNELVTVLALEPTLLSNDQFLAGHPELARFVAAHPEVRHNARFYLSEFGDPRAGRSVLESVLEPIIIFAVFSLITFALAWLVRTLIEQKRWNRLSRTQSEVHNKILDRFGTSSELLDYIKTPAGTKFLESAPIPLHTEPVRQAAPFTRLIWSVQIGVVLAAAALGMLLVSTRFEGESGRELFAMAIVALSLGLGFVASAAVSVFLSRRLGGLQRGNISESSLVE